MDLYPRPSIKKYWLTYEEFDQYLSLLKKRSFELNQMETLSCAPAFMRNNINQLIQELEARLNQFKQ